MQGAIVINPFLVPENSVIQAHRLKEEFNKLKVKTDIIDNAYGLINYDNGFSKKACKYDFVIYLDKDKYASKILESLGIRLYNSHRSIRICDDKGQTTVALSNSGINLPETVFAPLCYTDKPLIKEFITFIEKKLGYPVIVKESFGSMGRGVYLAKDRGELEKVSYELQNKPHIYQRYIGYKKGYDIRVIVIGKKVVCAMERQNENDFRSNVALGGKGSFIDIFDKKYSQYKRVAEKVAKTLSLDYCGVDLLVDKGDIPYVCEVNSNAFFIEMEKVSGINVAKRYAEYVVEDCKKVNKK